MLKLKFDGLFGLPGPVDGLTDPQKIKETMQLWFGVVYMVNMQMSFLSPPFGYALFYLKSVAPPHITMAMIFKAAMPFLLLQALGLTLVILFPQLILWLPKLAFSGGG
jgi:TRAP-type mannitol/chloroaromatic compound transport system permease large subunit